MARRQYGTGSVYRDGTRWVAALSVSSGDGTRRRKTFKRATREAAEAALNEWLAANPRQGPTLDGRGLAMERARAQGTHTADEWWAKVRSYGGLCHYCHRPWIPSVHKDHMTPVSRGGSDHIDNVVPTCADCNLTKSTATASEFVTWAEATGFFRKPRTRQGRTPLIDLPPLIREIVMSGGMTVEQWEASKAGRRFLARSAS